MNIEQPIIDRPWVIVRLNRSRFSVEVVAHCKTLTAAKMTVDELTITPSTIEHVIIGSGQLESYLKHERFKMAVVMEEQMLGRAEL